MMDEHNFYEGQWQQKQPQGSPPPQYTPPPPPQYPPNYQPPQPPQYPQHPPAAPGENSGANKKKPGSGVPIWVIVIGFVLSPILGLCLLGWHFYETGVIVQKKNSQNYMDAVQKEKENAGAPPPAYTAPAPGKKKAARRKSEANGFVNPASKRKISILSVLMIVIGAFLALGGSVSLVEEIDWIRYMGGIANTYGGFSDLFTYSALTLGGLGMIFSGWKNQKDIKIRVKLATIVGNADVVSVRKLADAAGISLRKCRKQLEICIDQGFFGPDAYLDLANDTLITSRAPQALRTAVAMEQEPPKPEPQTPEQAKSQYQRIIDQLHDLDEAIPGEEMSIKIRRLAAVSQKIFTLAEQDPDKLPQLRKFMDYYLPTALKLLTSYSQLDAQGVEGENITQAKNQIEAAMDGLCTAFETQLDRLFAADAMDISSDITVMENMIKADGLAGGTDFSL